MNLSMHSCLAGIHISFARAFVFQHRAVIVGFPTCPRAACVYCLCAMAVLLIAVDDKRSCGVSSADEGHSAVPCAHVITCNATYQ
jgi:hypothetical protein